jgi:cation:H+ antiporter
MTYILLLLGFVFLIKGAGYLVDGAGSLAKRFNISNLVIGLTVVAVGTSAPELFVNLVASFNGAADIAIGNIVGSNITNVFLILGIVAIIHPLRVGRSTIWKEIPISFFAAVMLLMMVNDRFIDGLTFNSLTRSDGIILMVFFASFLYYIFGITKSGGADEEQDPPRVYSGTASLGYMLLGILGLVIGGKWIVTSATTIAASFGLSEALIGLTIVAIGTSLPELATSVVAAFKKNTDIAIGNIVGSNIFNIFWVLGISSVIRPLPFTLELNFDLWVVVAASCLLFVWMFLGKRNIMERWQGVVFVLLYFAYMVIILARG